MAASDWKTLHPASVLVNLLPTAWRALRSMWPLVLALAIGGAQRRAAMLDLVLLTVLLILPISRTILHWATLRYRVEGGHLVIRTGVLNRQVRTIPPERIQNVELVRNVFHRMSGLVELRVETASGSDVEGMLSALTVEEAEQLLSALTAARRVALPEDDTPPPALLENGVRDLLRYGLTTTRFGLVLMVLGIGYEVLLTDIERAESMMGVLGTAGAAVGFIGLVLGAWLFGAGTVLVRHWDYRITQLGDRLVAEEGLLTRRRVELPASKVQLLTVRAPFVRRQLGFGSVAIETAAPREGGGGTQRAEAMVPVVDEAELGGLLRAAMPEAPPSFDALTFHPPHPRALIRAWLSGAMVTSAVAAMGSWFFWPWGLLGWLLVPLDALSSWLDHRHQGWWVGEDVLVSRTGWWVRNTRVVALRKLQSVVVGQGPLARRWDLAQLRLRVAGSGVALPVQSWDDALALEALLVRRSVSLLAAASEQLPALDDDEQAPGEEDPGDGLRHEAHEHQRGEHDAVPLGEAAVVAPGVHDRDDAEPHGEPRPEAEGVGDRGDLPVETALPSGPDPRLQEGHEALGHDEPPERDLHPSNDDSQA